MRSTLDFIKMKDFFIEAPANFQQIIPNVDDLFALLIPLPARLLMQISFSELEYAAKKNVK